MNELANELKISITGASARIGNTNSVDEFWKALCEKKILTTRFELKDLAPDHQIKFENPNLNYVPVRGAIQNSECFDHAFFGYSKEEAKTIDPQQRLLLEIAWNALEDAGYSLQQLDTKRVGVFVSTSENSYSSIIRSAEKDWRDSILFTTGNLRDLAPTRISYLFDLHGPSMNIQTACSSSLTLVHQACRSLLAGDCDIALVAAAAVRFPQNTGYNYQEGGIYSKDGFCRPFSKDSSGIVSGNGVIAVVLQRYEDAQAQSSPIYANISHIIANNDGKRKTGFAAPSTLGQSELYSQLYSDTGIDVSKIGYIEAHGTATPLGDPIEFAAHSMALKQFTELSQFCFLGSVKSNIGHLDAAAGLAGLLKTALILKNGVIPGHPTFLGPNPEINLESSPFKINTETTAWGENKFEYAGVGSLGIGGTNVFCLLEKVKNPTEISEKAKTEELIPFSSFSKDGIIANADSIISFINNSGNTLSNIAKSFAKNKNQFPYKSILLAKRDDGQNQVFRSKNMITNQSAQLCFVFPGGGHIDQKNLTKLLEFIPNAGKNLKEVLSKIKSTESKELLEGIFNGQKNEVALDLATSLLGTFAINHIIATSLIDEKILPSQLMGHSLGEYNAAVIAGGLSLESAIAIIEKRAEIMQKAPHCHLVLVKSLDYEIIADKTDCEVIAFNSKEAGTLCSSPEKFSLLIDFLKNNAVEYSVLSIRAAAHSKYLDPYLAEFEEFLNTLKFTPLAISCTSASQHRILHIGETLDKSYWKHHLRQPVHFFKSAQLTSALSEFNYLQIGPGFGLANVAASALTNQSALSTLGDEVENQPDEFKCIRHLLTKTPNEVVQNITRIRLPSYIFDKTSFSINQKVAIKQRNFRLYSEIVTSDSDAIWNSRPSAAKDITAQLGFVAREMSADQMTMQIFESAAKLEKENKNHFLRVFVDSGEVKNPFQTYLYLQTAITSINQEFSNVTAQLVFTKKPSASAIEKLNCEYLGPSFIDGDQIFNTTYSELKIPSENSTVPIQNICLLGGSGRVGIALSSQILLHSDHKICIVSRRHVSAESFIERVLSYAPRSAAEKIKNSRHRITFECLDASLEKDVKNLFQKQAIPFTTIVYTASASKADSIRKSLEDISIEDLKEQSAPKSNAFLIWKNLMLNNCKHIIFSSNAARLSGPGLSAYAYANAYLNSLAYGTNSSIINFDAFRFSFEDKQFSSNTKNYINDTDLWQIFNSVLQGSPKELILSSEPYIDRLFEWVYQKPKTSLDITTNHKQRSPMETLKFLWSEVLGVDPATLNKNSHFRNLGGQSILAFRLAAFVKREFKKSIKMHHIAKHPMFGEMLEVIESLGSFENPSQTIAIEQVLDIDQLLEAVNRDK